MSIPAYLQEVNEAEHYYGVLRPVITDGEVKSWIIEGEPCVVELAKRLFPGSNSMGAGKARFPNNKRIVADLNWLMLRYPLEIKDQGRWKKSYQDAVQYAIRRQELLKQPQKITPPPLEFKGELKEFQKEGLAFLINNERTLLADEMGLGKTVQALAFLATKKAYPALIVAPPHLIKNWQREIERFVRLPDKGQISLLQQNAENAVHTIKGLKPYRLPEASVYLIHYLLLRGWKDVLPEVGFQAVIFDEIQELRHGKTEKYSAASLLSSGVPYVIGLSGTPIYNRGGEIWHVLNIIEYHCLGDWDSFTREWCHGYGSDVVKKPDLLGSYLKREGLLIRRTKEQVLNELPPKRRVVQTVDFDSGRYGELIQGAIDKAKQIDGISDHFEKGRMIRDIVGESRQAIGIAKAPYVCAFVKMLLDAGEAVLLFAYHHAVFDIYQQELKDYNPVEITGRQDTKEKNRSEQAFMSGETNVCLISLRAAAGLNLQRATCVVFGELDWSPAVHSQAEDRAHRMGQKDSVLCYYLVAEEGTDETIQEFLGLKVSQFVGIMGDKEETEEDRAIAQSVATQHMNKIVERLKTCYNKVEKGGGKNEQNKKPEPDIICAGCQ
jgi:SNF2 family DNA or RNA helicase